MALSPARRWAVVVGAVALADTLVVSTAKPFTWTAGVATAIGIVGVLAARAISTARHREATGEGGTPKPKPTRRGVYAWAGLAAAIGVFELVNFLLLPRHDHPTISSLLGVLTAEGVARAALFAGWLLAGWWWWVAPS